MPALENVSEIFDPTAWNPVPGFEDLTDLTYHRAATRKQVESAYPRFEQFLEKKKQYDPDERFQSEWYRHYRQLWRGDAAGTAR